MVLGKRKQPKTSRKNRDQDTLTKDANRKKRKKKEKDTLGRKKEKKKDKKKKKKKPSVVSDSDVITQVSHAQADPTMIYKTPSLCRQPDQEVKTKRKKKVMFDLSPGNIRVQRPHFFSASRPKNDTAFEYKTTEDMARLREDNNSPGHSEDINSQDLFITQKTFRVLSPEPSSGETCSATTSAPARMQQIVKSENCEQESPTTCLYGGQHLWKSHMTECFTEEKMRMKKTCCGYENGESCSQVKVELRTVLSECESIDAQPQVNRSLAQPTVVNASPSRTFGQRISASTQTENFFTCELSSYLSFVHKASERLSDLKPLDLSLPRKARKEDEGNRCKNPEPESGCSLKMKEDQKDPSAGGLAEANLSFGSDSGQKSAESKDSSGEEQPGRTRLDLTQVRVQDP